MWFWKFYLLIELIRLNKMELISRSLLPVPDLKILCTINSIKTFLCCNGAQLMKFRNMPISVNFWYQGLLFFLFIIVYVYVQIKMDFQVFVEIAYSRYSRVIRWQWTLYHPHKFNSYVSSFAQFSTKKEQFPACSYILVFILLCKWNLGILHETKICKICTRLLSLTM